MSNNQNPLEEARKTINEVDSKIAELFVERMKAAEVIAEYKKARGLEIFDATREAEVIKKNSEKIEDDTLRDFYITFLKNTMAVSRSYQYRIMEGMKVAYSGTEGAFAHIAASKLYPTSNKVSYSDFALAYRAVEEGECDVCVLPIENSSNGEVGAVTDLMFSGSLYITGIFDLEVTQDLLALPGAVLSDIKTVVSHSQALGQCAPYIKKHNFETIEYANTALAAKYVSELSDKSVAAIASEYAAERFSLSVLDHGINEKRSNTTRFAVFSRIANKISSSKTDVHSALLFTVRNEAGALAKAIDVIGLYGFNMRTLRSRPMKELLWEYYFYIELEGDVQTEKGKRMMEALSEFCDKLKFAGAYTKL